MSGIGKLQGKSIHKIKNSIRFLAEQPKELNSESFFVENNYDDFKKLLL